MDELEKARYAATVFSNCRYHDSEIWEVRSTTVEVFTHPEAKKLWMHVFVGGLTPPPPKTEIQVTSVDKRHHTYTSNEAYLIAQSLSSNQNQLPGEN